MLIGPNADQLFIRIGKDPTDLYSINTSS